MNHWKFNILLLKLFLAWNIDCSATQNPQQDFNHSGEQTLQKKVKDGRIKHLKYIKHSQNVIFRELSL